MLPAPARVAYAIGSTAESVVFSISGWPIASDPTANHIRPPQDSAPR